MTLDPSHPLTARMRRARYAISIGAIVLVAGGTAFAEASHPTRAGRPAVGATERPRAADANAWFDDVPAGPTATAPGASDGWLQDGSGGAAPVQDAQPAGPQPSDGQAPTSQTS